MIFHRTTVVISIIRYPSWYILVKSFGEQDNMLVHVCELNRANDVYIFSLIWECEIDTAVNSNNRLEIIYLCTVYLTMYHH